MKFLCIVNQGMEDITSLEIKEVLNKNSEIKEGAVLFEGTKDNAQLLAYRTQSINRILILLSENKQIKEKTEKKFRVRCIKIDTEINSRDLEKEIGTQIDGEVDLDNPEVNYIVYAIKNNIYIGLDNYGDLSKREYRIFGNDLLKAPIHYALLKMGNYNSKLTLLDPFCRTGQLCIEAALYASKTSPRKHNFDIKNSTQINQINPNIIAIDSSFAFINNTKKNAKIAGINKLINFSRLEIEWLDTKFKENEIDLIITTPPQLSSKNPNNKIEKNLEEFFHQSEFILKKKGKIVLGILNQEKILEIAKKYGFNLIEKRQITQGEANIIVLVLQLT